MGVPVVTLAGTHATARAGVSILSNANLAQFIADSADNYARLAIETTRDVNGLTELRRILRQHLGQSPLMNEPSFAADFQHAMRTAWHAFSATAQTG
jgi:predicted O-linked N-acetylglucosamine transferase (SPINDLY family)